MAYADLAAEVAGVLPGVSSLLAATFVTRAWRDIRNERNWSFKNGIATLICPPQVTTGTAAWTQYGTSVTFSAAATTALTPYIAGTPLLTTLQIRFSNGPLYRILTVTQPSPLIVTVDRPIIEATATAGAYSVYRAYVTPPVADFSRWDALQDFASQRTLTGARLTRSVTEFDRRDPGRTSMGEAAFLGVYTADATTGQVLYELWPHPSQGQTFLVTFKRFGPDFLLPTDTQPAVIPDALIVTKALGWYGYPWAQANKARIPDLKATDFLTLIQLTRQQYVSDLATIKTQDEELAPEWIYNRGHYVTSPFRGDPPLGDAKYWQSHPIYW